MAARDTSNDASAVRTVLYRRMTPGQRCDLAVE
jgi:hypothetical protein